MAKILVIEDEDDIRALVALHLKGDGFEVAQAEDGLIGLEKCLSFQPDLVIMDISMPRLSGLDLCRRLRGDGRFKNLPIIMLTARAEEIDRVVGLELGADDYVTKPFSLRELALRAMSLLKRARSGPEEPAPLQEGAVLRFGRLVINPQTHEIHFAEEPIPLTALEFRLLYYLAQRPGRVLTRAQLLEDVWGYSEENYARTVDTHMRRLRQKLGDAGHVLETVRGVGYKFKAAP